MKGGKTSSVLVTKNIVLFFCFVSRDKNSCFCLQIFYVSPTCSSFFFKKKNSASVGINNTAKWVVSQLAALLVSNRMQAMPFCPLRRYTFATLCLVL